MVNPDTTQRQSLPTSVNTIFSIFYNVFTIFYSDILPTAANTILPLRAVSQKYISTIFSIFHNMFNIFTIFSIFYNVFTVFYSCQSNIVMEDDFTEVQNYNNTVAKWHTVVAKKYTGTVMIIFANSNSQMSNSHLKLFEDFLSIAIPITLKRG